MLFLWSTNAMLNLFKFLRVKNYLYYCNSGNNNSMIINSRGAFSPPFKSKQNYTKVIVTDPSI